MFQAFTWFADVLQEHNEMFWSLFAVDMDACLEIQPADCWNSFSLFSLLNGYLLNDSMNYSYSTLTSSMYLEFYVPVSLRAGILHKITDRVDQIMILCVLGVIHRLNIQVCGVIPSHTAFDWSAYEMGQLR